MSTPFKLRFANEIARSVTADGMQVMGGYGYHKEYGMEQRVRDGLRRASGGKKCTEAHCVQLRGSAC